MLNTTYVRYASEDSLDACTAQAAILSSQKSSECTSTVGCAGDVELPRAVNASGRMARHSDVCLATTDGFFIKRWKRNVILSIESKK